ncbi:MAG: Holliday junction branch migration DNA helicase RuvB [Chloroflexi bacterium]|uniref:Holliday junction branch migration complex subunit RuvB n=1 Tax=Candidatus Chlorohelix allophototropha TaxID=3003348 RepID=A0A8T7M383_9CHLR|nr:Holliday junction branch migration DNA helicase RuvB [Chloroflexota bacterium]WJW67378.1 Holliday junction branch migration DNA helicase RuvB [Chloroflexota bacterium L227-S17]
MLDSESNERPISAKKRPEERAFEATLRPRTIAEYIGQDKIKESLQILIEAAKARKEPLDHVLFYGPPGLGKTTLSNILAAEMGVNIRVTSGPAIERAGDLVAILTNLKREDILFIDEIHRLNRTIEEVLYPAMEDFAVDLVTGKGPSAQTIHLRLPRFTIIGATTRLALLTSPLRDRFGAVYRLDFYDQAAMELIIQRSAVILRIPVDAEGAAEIARRSRGTPRVANRLLKRVRDYAQVRAEGHITRKVAQDALNMLDVDELGLDDGDRRILTALIDKFDGGPVGIETLAAATSEETDAIMDVYEPYLLQLGFIVRTPRGRIVTQSAYDHLKRNPTARARDRLGLVASDTTSTVTRQSTLWDSATDE